MKGIKIAARNKDLNKAQPKDEVLDTGLVTIPIISKKKFRVELQSGTLYGSGGATFPSTQIPHGLGYAPLFRGWIETVSLTTGDKTGSKYSIPFLSSSDIGFYAESDSKNITITSIITGATYTPTTKLAYDGYMYIFGSRVE